LQAVWMMLADVLTGPPEFVGVAVVESGLGRRANREAACSVTCSQGSLGSRRDGIGKRRPLAARSAG